MYTIFWFSAVRCSYNPSERICNHYLCFVTREHEWGRLHYGYRLWKKCNRFVTDFVTFLSICFSLFYTLCYFRLQSYKIFLQNKDNGVKGKRRSLQGSWQGLCTLACRNVLLFSDLLLLFFCFQTNQHSAIPSWGLSRMGWRYVGSKKRCAGRFTSVAHRRMSWWYYLCRFDLNRSM